jgi:hypothetical protein
MMRGPMNVKLNANICSHRLWSSWIMKSATVCSHHTHRGNHAYKQGWHWKIKIIIREVNKMDQILGKMWWKGHGMENHTKKTYCDLQITKPHWCDYLLPALWNDTSPLDAVSTQINTVLHIIITVCWLRWTQNALLHDLNHAYLICCTHTSPLMLFLFLNLQTHHWCGNRNPDISYKFIVFNICDIIKMRRRYNINE